MKKLIASLTVLFLCCSLLIIPTSAAEITDSGTCGETLTWTLDSTGVLTISGEGALNRSYFAHNDNIKAVVIKEGVTQIGYGAFSSCKNLTEVTLPSTLERIQPQAFNNCSSLNSIIIPANVNYIGAQCFSRNVALTSIFVDPANSFFTSVDGVLFTKDMSKLVAYPSGKENTAYTIPDGVEIIETFSFFANEHLTSITFPESLTTIKMRAFMQTNLLSVHLPASLEVIEECALSGFDLLTITVDEGNPYFTSIAGSLYSKDGYTLLQYPAGNTISDYAIPDGTQIIDGNAFMYAYKLRNVSIPASVTEARDTPFNLADYLLNITVDPDNQVYCSVDGVMFSKDMTTLFAYPAGNPRTEYSVPEGVTTLGTYSFYSATHLENLIMPETLTDVQDYVFGLCYQIPSLVFPEGIKTIGEDTIFLCTNLESIYLPVSLESIAYLDFDNCPKLTDIYFGGTEEQWTVLCSNSDIRIPDGVTVHFQSENTNDGPNEELTWTLENGVLTLIGSGPMNDYTFGDAPWYNWANDITNIVIDERLTTIGSCAFADCCITSIEIPKGVTSIGNDAFQCCQALTEVDIPAGVTSIGDWAFFGCEALTQVTLPSTLNSIGASAFHACTALTEIVIPEGVVTIGNDAFFGCHALTKVVLPSTLTSIGSCAFTCCWSLTEIVIPENVVSIGDRAFGECFKLTEIGVETGNQHYISSDGILFSKDMSVLVCFPMGKRYTSYVIPEGVTSIGNYACYHWSSLTDITLPSTLTAIGEWAFSDCDALTKVVVPDGVTFVDCNAFYRCDNLVEVFLPSSLTAMNDYAFYSENLKDVYFAGSEKQWLSAVGNSISVVPDDAVIHFNATGPVTTLKAPTIMVTNRASDGKPVISWTAVEGATGYEVWRCGTKNGTYTKIYSAPANDFDLVHIGAIECNDYFYKVRALSDDITGEFSTAKGVWCDLKPPSITVTNRASDGKPVISWKKVNYATGYKVYCADTGTGTYKQIYSTTNPNKLSVTHIGAKAGEDYFYKVVATHTNSKCNSAMSAYKGVYCDLAQPALTVELNSNGKPYLSWAAVDGAESYKVYRSVNNGDYELMCTAAANDLDVIDTGATDGNDYCYKVIALYPDNSECNSAYSKVKGVCLQPVEAPRITVTNRAADGKPLVQWTSAEGAAIYQVYWSSTKNGEYKLLYTAGSTKLSMAYLGAVPGKTYFFKVCAVHNNNSFCTKAFSEAKGVYCDLAQPTLSVELNSSGKPYLSWTKVTGADGYKVYRSTDGETWTRMYTAKANDFDVTHIGAKADTTYYYRVIAISNATSKANSAYSAAKHITMK